MTEGYPLTRFRLAPDPDRPLAAIPATRDSPPRSRDLPFPRLSLPATIPSRDYPFPRLSLPATIPSRDFVLPHPSRPVPGNFSIAIGPLPPLTGGEGEFTQWVHGEFMVSSEAICLPDTHWAHAEY